MRAVLQLHPSLQLVPSLATSSTLQDSHLKSYVMHVQAQQVEFARQNTPESIAAGKWQCEHVACMLAACLLINVGLAHTTPSNKHCKVMFCKCRPRRLR